MKIFMLGIGGISMSGIAIYLKQIGFEVAGSDMIFTEITDDLNKKGIQVYNESHDISGYDIIIYTSAVKPTHPQFAKAKKLNKKLIRRAEVLASLATQGMQLAIAGTHGKTSSSSMLAHILHFNKLNPTAFIGGIAGNFNTNTVIGDTKYFVLEADEYDRSFLSLNPIHLSILGIEEDHLDIYNGIDDIVDTYQQLANKIPFFGTLLINNDSELCQKIKPTSKCITFGFEENSVLKAEIISNADFATVSNVYFNNNLLGKLKLFVPGKFNIYNALAAIGIAMQVGVSFDNAAKAMQSYKGVKRRFELLGSCNGAVFYDDYAHHPSEIEQTLLSIKKSSSKRIVAIFEPHLFSRTYDFYKGFAKALNIADEILLMPIYPAREKPVEGVTTKLIFDELEKIGRKDKKNLLKSKEELYIELDRIIQKNDIVITLGAGTVTYFGREYLNKVKQSKKND